MTDEEILTKLGLDGADESIRKDAIENVRTIVELRVIGLISEAVDDNQREEFERLQESDDTNAVWDWLRREVVGTDVSEVYEGVLHDYLEEQVENKFEPAE